MVAREWRLVGRQFGRIATVSQLFSVLLFPQLFSTLHCAFRSAQNLPLSLTSPTPPADHRVALILSSLSASTTPLSRAFCNTDELFVIIADERSGNGGGRAGRWKKHPLLSFSLSLSDARRAASVVTGEQPRCPTWIDFFSPSGSSAVVLFMPAPLLPPDRRRLPKRSRFSPDARRRAPPIAVSRGIYLTPLARSRNFFALTFNREESTIAEAFWLYLCLPRTVPSKGCLFS